MAGKLIEDVLGTIGGMFTQHQTVIANATNEATRYSVEHPGGVNRGTVQPNQADCINTKHGEIQVNIYSGNNIAASRADVSDRSFIIKEQGGILVLRDQKYGEGHFVEDMGLRK